MRQNHREAARSSRVKCTAAKDMHTFQSSDSGLGRDTGRARCKLSRRCSWSGRVAAVLSDDHPRRCRDVEDPTENRCQGHEGNADHQAWDIEALSRREDVLEEEEGEWVFKGERRGLKLKGESFTVEGNTCFPVCNKLYIPDYPEPELTLSSSVYSHFLLFHLLFPIACLSVFSTSASCYNTTFFLHFHSTRCPNLLIWPSTPFHCPNPNRRPGMLPCVRTTA